MHAKSYHCRTVALDNLNLQCEMLLTKFIITLLMALAISKPSIQIVIQNTRLPLPVDYGNCEYLEYQPSNFLTCICLDGIWAFQIDKIEGYSEWRIIGGDNDCFHLDEWVSHVQKISNTTTEPALRRFGISSTFVVVNKQDWEVESSYDELGRGKVCFPAALKQNSYCLYKLHPDIRTFDRSMKQDCSTRSAIQKEYECKEVLLPTSLNLTEMSACALVPSQQTLSRKKRQDPNDGNSPAETPVDDEDAKSPEEVKRRVGNPEMMTYISDYVMRQVNKLIEDANAAASGASKRIVVKSKKTTPTQSLLELCSEIAQRLCSPIQPGTFDISMNSFLMLQMHKFHLKEPYIAFPAFQRILESMEKCKAEARAFMFDGNNTECASTLPTAVSPNITIGGTSRGLPKLPDHAIAKPGVFELVIEVVWKTFLMAHSYCFRYFNEYYNDHHTFTVAMIPFFTNMIQEVWLANSTASGGGESSTPPGPPTEGGPAFNYTTDQIWYGNLLGDAGVLFESVDYCYAASRFGPSFNPSNNYPWFLKRPKRDPTNEWIEKASAADPPAERRKRSISTVSGQCGVLSELDE